MDLANIQAVLKGEPKYRLAQIDKLIFQDFISDWQEATVLPLSLRVALREKSPLTLISETVSSKDGQTIKALLTLDDGLKIEAVLMRFKDRNTVCVSSQVGCPLGCLFCATGQMGFKRNLNPSEIIGQVLLFARILKREDRKVTNVVFMGMGEPFLNYNNVLESIKILNDPAKMGLGARRFSVSTCGIIEGIKKLAAEPLEINLAISLHAPNDEIRTKLMPINKKYPLVNVMDAVGDYLQRTKRKVMFEYVLLDSVNDSEECAKELVQLLKQPLYHLNLIQYNQTGIFRPSTPPKVAAFKKVLEKKGISFTERYRFGSEIRAACGQLVSKT
ncbi:MAG: 23S rRNA (adenine(2503)-C(2))-methyltransferase RlmN [bacterium]|nr:23S rRNA (adenine(2503)-C(2))-methyltransferase RlmN [bacterium]